MNHIVTVLIQDVILIQSTSCLYLIALAQFLIDMFWFLSDSWTNVRYYISVYQTWHTDMYHLFYKIKLVIVL